MTYKMFFLNTTHSIKKVCDTDTCYAFQIQLSKGLVILGDLAEIIFLDELEHILLA